MPARPLLYVESTDMPARSRSAHKENDMSNAAKRAAGAAQELSGKLKKALGRAIGNPRMEAMGKARELEGQARQLAARTAERAKSVVQEAIGAANANKL
jgi:uncharacterized protein YjbJ (UPF0337 family)